MTCTDIRLLKGGKWLIAGCAVAECQQCKSVGCPPAVSQLCRMPLDMGGGVRLCDLADPYTAVLLADGTIALVELCEGEHKDGDTSLAQTWPEIGKVVCFDTIPSNRPKHYPPSLPPSLPSPQGTRVTLLSAYADHSGLFSTQLGELPPPGSAQSAPPPTVKQEPKSTVDEEEELLYGDISSLIAVAKKERCGHRQVTSECC